MNMTRQSREVTAMKRALIIGSTIGIAMMIAAGAARVSARASDTAEIKALEQRLIDGIKSKDAKQIMSCYSDDVFAYDVVPPREYVEALARLSRHVQGADQCRGERPGDQLRRQDRVLAQRPAGLGNDERGQAVR